jgi:hypothetical protein
MKIGENEAANGGVNQQAKQASKISAKMAKNKAAAIENIGGGCCRAVSAATASAASSGGENRRQRKWRRQWRNGGNDKHGVAA